MTVTGRHRHCQSSLVKSVENGPAARAAGKLATARAVCQYKNSGDARRTDVRSALQPACWDLQTLPQWRLVRCPSLSIGGCLRLMPLRY